MSDQERPELRSRLRWGGVDDATERSLDGAPVGTVAQPDDGARDPGEPSAPDDPAGAGDGDEAQVDASARLRRQVLEWVGLIGVAVVIALVVKAFLVQAFYIPSGSMEPTLNISDRVLVNKLAYDFGDPSRGDLVVFDAPPEARTPEVQELVKRVIGLPGETIESRDGVIYIDSDGVGVGEDARRLEEPYLPEGTDMGIAISPTFIPEDHYFVMGDNRSQSFDSRYFGTIAGDAIVGRAFIRIWPLDDFGFL